MLTYGSGQKQKFDKIRARWETAQPPSTQPYTMAGPKEKPAAHQPLNTVHINGGGSKFRRKLSHGLSLISVPLSQRKTTPSRLPLAPVALPVVADNSDYTSSDRRIFPIYESTSFGHLRPSPVQNATTNKPNDPNDATPKPLPRSQTLSYIPRPSRTASRSTVPDSEGISKPCSPQVTFAPQSGASPSKIPSPPATKRRLSSPRQYLPPQTALQSKRISAGMVCAPARTSTPTEIQSSPPKVSVRSYTTPNLMKRKTSPRQGSFIMSQNSTLHHKHCGPLDVQRPSMKENHIPTDKPDSCRTSHVQDLSSCLATPSVASQRHSLGLSRYPRQSKQAVRTTPPNANRLGTTLATQIPLTAKRMQQKEQPSFHSPTTHRYSNRSAIAQRRLIGPVNPPTPQVVDHVATHTVVPRERADKDLQIQTIPRLRSEVKGNSVGMESKAMGVGNIEVRQTLPRSCTFHNFRIQHDPPPVPPIPAMYKSFSQPLLIVPGSLEEGSKDPLSFTSQEKLSDHGWIPRSLDSKSENVIETSSPFIVDLDDANLGKQVETKSDPNRPLAPGVAVATPSRSERSWSIHDQHVECSDTDGQVQVTEYMPPLWWAGRFQSRFDQWRTQAMMAELDPKYKPEAMPGRCSLSQEKVAACYIFLQLRDSCVSNQAADSLWVSSVQKRDIVR
jgi:hypothetical protein